MRELTLEVLVDQSNPESEWIWDLMKVGGEMKGVQIVSVCNGHVVDDEDDEE